MTTKTQALTRIFRFGSINLPDPEPTMKPEKVLELYMVNYPHLASAVIEQPTVQGSKMIYEFKPAPVKTKG